MPAKRLDGQKLAKQLTDDLALQVAKQLDLGRRAPGLAVVLVGEDPASALYVARKVQACKKVDMQSFEYHLPHDCSQAQLLDLIYTLNQQDDVDGILVQLPLPAHLSEQAVLDSIDPNKDVDAFHPHHVGRLSQRRPSIHPCTPHAVVHLLHSTDLTDFSGLHAVVVGASNIVGRPMAMELLLLNCTVTICHRSTIDLAHHVRQADILVVAAGQPHLIQGEWIKPGAIVVDVGMNRLADGRLVGDVVFEAAAQRASWITPVPGGVGPMTIAMLLENTFKQYTASHQSYSTER